MARQKKTTKRTTKRAAKRKSEKKSAKKPARKKAAPKKPSKKAARKPAAKKSTRKKTARRAAKKTALPGRQVVPKTYKLYVNGAFVRSESGHYLTATDERGRFVAHFARASRKDFRDAVGAARQALGPWVARSAFNRSQILFRMAEMLEHRRGVFESSLTEHAGRSADAARREVSAAVDRIFWYAGWCDKFAQVLGGVNPVASPFFNFTIPEAVGVVTVFAPTASPLLGFVSAISPVILSGNTSVVIVDDDAPQVAIDFAEVLATSDLPGGVVNVLTGHRDELAPHAASHMDVNAIAYYGEPGAALERLQRAAAENVKRVHVLEDRPAEGWLARDAQSLYLIQPFVEWKTAWHPIGV